MDQRVDELAATLKLIQEQNASIQQAEAASTTIFEGIKPAVLELVEWRPGLSNQWRICVPSSEAYAETWTPSSATLSSPSS